MGTIPTSPGSISRKLVLLYLLKLFHKLAHATGHEQCATDIQSWLILTATQAARAVDFILSVPQPEYQDAK